MKKRKVESRLLICVSILVSIFASILFCADLLYADFLGPIKIDATMRQGKCITENKVVTLEGSPASVDIMFSFDLTGSMGGIINTAKAEAISIMTAIQTALPSSTIRFGVASYMDYPHVYGEDEANCGYYGEYGALYAGDYAYSLDQALTDDTTAVSTAINALVLGYGADGPQDYTRPFYESYADSENIGWGKGVKIWINFGDNVPHDCNLNEGVPGASGTWTTGGDPGRDEIMGTVDDLDLQTVLAGMAANHIILMELHTSSYANTHWTYWTGLTGGSLFLTGSSGSGLIDKIVASVEEAVRNIDSLTLEASAGYADWLTSVVPSGYTNIHVPETGLSFDFEIQICVPEAMECGLHKFTINAVGDGAVLASQDVSIDVPCNRPAFRTRLEFDAVGCDATNYFNDFIRTAVCDIGTVNTVSGVVKINEFSSFANESFTTTAGQLYPDPCFDQMRGPNCRYTSALTAPWNEGVYTWVIVLQKKPESDIDLNIRDCVLKHNEFDVWQNCEQTGRYRAPWGQLFFVPTANPIVTVTAKPGPYPTPGFPAAGFTMDARSMPGLGLSALQNAVYTSKCLWEESLVMKLPATGGVNVLGQAEYNLKQGDVITVVVQIPPDNSVDVFYGHDNVSIKYTGIVGTEYITDGTACGVCGECATGG